MKFLISLFALVAAVAAASPRHLAETHSLDARAVYPKDGEVCCRRDGARNCICVARSNKDCDRGICTS